MRQHCKQDIKSETRQDRQNTETMEFPMCHLTPIASKNLFAVMDKCGGYYESFDQERLHKEVIADLKKYNYEVHHVNKYIDHDGCDKDGYESDIIDLVVWVIGPNKECEAWFYHTEQWFDTDNGPPPYTFEDSFRFDAQEDWEEAMICPDWYDLQDFLKKVSAEEEEEVKGVPPRKAREERLPEDEDAEILRRNEVNAICASELVDEGCPCGCDDQMAWWRDRRDCRMEVQVEHELMSRKEGV